jgi:GNAT superfamily N-acetyltransferase
MSLSAPAPITSEHDLSSFSCGHESLDAWLRRRALSNQESGATRTYVSVERGRVLGYYALASGGLASAGATGRFRRNMPDPVPVAILARLAVDQTVHGQGLGRALFRDAALRVMSAADVIGIRGLIVHAISAQAAAFYEAIGLVATLSEPRTLMVTLEDLRAAL